MTDVGRMTQNKNYNAKQPEYEIFNFFNINFIDDNNKFL